MTERKWTKGPWVSSDDTADNGGWFRSIVSKCGNYVVDEEGIGNDADANLIAAAPDLYEALALVITFGVDYTSLDTALAALAKARGETK